MAKSSKKPSTSTKLSSADQKRINTFKGYVNAGKGVSNDILGKNFAFQKVDDSTAPAGASTSAMSKIIDAAKTSYQGAGQNTPQQTDALGRLSDLSTHAGDRSAETQDTIDQSKKLQDNAGVVDPNVQTALDKMKSGLGGLSSTENQALYEQLTRDARNTFQGGSRAADANAAASGGMTNPSLMRSLLSDYTRSKLGAAGDVLSKNADVVTQRQGQYGTFSDQVASRLFGQQRDATSLYGSTVGGVTQDEFTRKLAADQAYNTGVETNVTDNRSDVQNRLAQWSQSVTSARADQLQRITTNNNSLAAAISAKTGIILGVPQYIMGEKAADDANALANKEIDAASKNTKKPAAGGGPVAHDSFGGTSVGATGGGGATSNGQI